MKRSSLVSASVVLVCAASSGVAWAASPHVLPALPGPGAPAQTSQPTVASGGSNDAPSAANPASPGAGPTPMQVYEHVMRGVVAIERNGLPVGIGTVLGSDGRILTALSTLGGADGADVRYVDGTTVHAKVDHSDRAVDLALLVAQAGKSIEGLSASEADPMAVDLRAMLPDRSAHFGPAPAGLKGLADARTRDGERLARVLDVDVRGPTVAGAPLLDANGNVVAVLARACRGSAQGDAAAAASSTGGSAHASTAPSVCQPMVVGVPVSTIRSFLSQTMAAVVPASAPAATPGPAVAPAPAFLGIRGVAQSTGDVHGVRVVAVAPSSPAEKGGLHPTTDVIVAVDGKGVDTPAKLAEAIGKHAPGDSVKLLVFGDGKFRETSVDLRSAP